ncbi:YbhB/YbcL family Raf kinase inhibitor-like protein [Edaphobacter modestus]|uniref:PBP family phospholipid-binding protein n=1 Tax=Edaphobacter modestus TaxID=388466 RepID=A0A4Q7YVS9_9BACT|nr:YbhB/YbcL family Raf kinase inhibitor-like protein [Edaphobacter modestus]RZU42002.1 PBP family phospholipid-binding protein [Edaphobacter modestus]
MKHFLLSAILFSISGVGLSGQAPATPPPAKPGLTLTTSAFEDGGIIPIKYTQAAAPATPVSPELAWAHVPEGTVSFALVLDDPDTSLNRTTEEVLHWLVFNIPGTAKSLPENVGDQAQLPDGSIQALNRQKKVGYLGMGAPAAGPYHHYTFQLYALDTKLSLGPDATRADVMKAMDGHILGKGVVVGRFHRP